MRLKIKKIVRLHFEAEVASKKTAPFPDYLTRERQLHHTSKGDSLFIAAMLFASLILLSTPAVYESSLRNTYIPMSKIEAFKEEFPRAIFEASVEYKERKGVYNDQIEIYY